MPNDGTITDGIKVKVVDQAGRPISAAVVSFSGTWGGREQIRGGGRTGSEGLQGLKGAPDDRAITVKVTYENSKGWEEAFAWVDGKIYSICLDDVTAPGGLMPNFDETQVIILIHGIRDYALWQNSIRRAFERHFAVVEPTNFERFDLFRFLLPFGFFRRAAIEKVWDQIRDTKRQNPDKKYSFVAHSFGTYVLAHILREEFDFTAYRVVLCGSVLRYDFPFEQVAERFTRPILNEVGAKDVWPAMAVSITWGYGSAGTYGFRRSRVRDRWHTNAHHGYFLTPEFCERYWVPFFKDGTIVEGAENPEAPPLWIRTVSTLRLKYLLLILVLFCSIAFLPSAPSLSSLTRGTTSRTSTSVAAPPSILSRAEESLEDVIDPHSPGASIRKVLKDHGDIVDIDVEPKDIWVLMAKPLPNGWMHLNGDGSLFPDSEMSIIHIVSGTDVLSSMFTVLPFQKREQKNLLPDAIIFTYNDYVYCFINSLAGENGYNMHGGIYQFDTSNLSEKSAGQLFDSEKRLGLVSSVHQRGPRRSWAG